MPYYTYRCEVCRKNEDRYQKISDRDLRQTHGCSSVMHRIITAPAILPDIASYISPASGKVINSRAQRRDDLAREGCVPLEPGLKEHIAQRAVYEQEKAFETTSRAIDQTVSEMHASGLISGD